MFLFNLNIDEQESLEKVYSNLTGDRQQDIPFWVWLVENPHSYLALPGAISLQKHDYLHILLCCDRSSSEEAFIIGFTMGNDRRTRSWHLIIYKLISRYFYPKKYRFSSDDLQVFDWGVECGRNLATKNLNQFNFEDCLEQSIAQLRKLLRIDLNELKKR